MGEYRRARKQGAETMVTLSHPKMMTPFSMRCMQQLLEDIQRNGDQVVGYDHFDAIA